MTADENGALVRRSIEQIWNRGDLAVADDLFVPAYVLHLLYGVDEAGHSGPLGVRQRVAVWRAALRDLRITVEEVVAAGDKVVTRWSGRGMDSEDHWWGTPASGNVVTWRAILISRVADGKIAEEWLLWDRLGLWQQLGVAPPTPLLFAPGAASSHASDAAYHERGDRRGAIVGSRWRTRPRHV